MVGTNIVLLPLRVRVVVVFRSSSSSSRCARVRRRAWNVDEGRTRTTTEPNREVSKHATNKWMHGMTRHNMQTLSIAPS